MSDIKNIPTLLDIAQKAIDFDACHEQRKQDVAALRERYNEWRRERDFVPAEPDSPEWQAIKEDTKGLYDLVQSSRREEKNARRRLATAIRRYRNGEAAQ